LVQSSLAGEVVFRSSSSSSSSSSSREKDDGRKGDGIVVVGKVLVERGKKKG
jgi:hypothetical protein